MSYEYPIYSNQCSQNELDCPSVNKIFERVHGNFYMQLNIEKNKSI